MYCALCHVPLYWQFDMKKSSGIDFRCFEYHVDSQNVNEG